MTTHSVHAIRLLPGQDLKKELDTYVKLHELEAAWVVTCVGSLTDTHIRYANQPAGARMQGHFEIVSLAGTLSTHGSHLHLAVSDSMGVTTGGHLLDGNLVYTTAEIVIGTDSNLRFLREADGSTPWKELQIRKKEK